MWNIVGKGKKDSKAIYFCDGKKCCRYNDAPKSLLENLLKTQCCDISLKKMKCQGMCKKAPVFYLPSIKKYKKNVDIEKATKIAEKYLV